MFIIFTYTLHMQVVHGINTLRLHRRRAVSCNNVSPPPGRIPGTYFFKILNQCPHNVFYWKNN